MNASLKIRSHTALLEVLSHEVELDYLFFWGHRVPKDGSVSKSCFSQWYPARFEVNGESYQTAEHFMMASKARLFGDSEVERQILACTNPGEAKKLGRKVRNFDVQKWEESRFPFVVEGNVAKFSQHEALRKFLLSTGDKILVEASPYDRIWGVGLGVNDPRIEDPTQWRGLNLLGFALMEAREQLKN